MFVDSDTDRGSHDDFGDNNENGGLLGGCMVGRLLILYFKLRDADGATASCPCLRMWLTMQSTSLVIPSLHLYQLSVIVYILHFLGHISGGFEADIGLDGINFLSSACDCKLHLETLLFAPS